MSQQNPNSNYDVNELWFVKFFVGSMVSITVLTVILSFLPSPSGLRNSPQNKTVLLLKQHHSPAFS
ncbi:hypothetical protein [Pseudanabaena mucicola]|uniref:Uncharacterized protein n=1 Tax=Pseudanabaena mucicola FACHB-723 TaxID=2692860 RepID=A0ABR7ZWP0_9CYAN|nr:hypothetical protein [Pseudanabaena mucicola]MBD2188185.1 hypothetical protein [Pseudanabaena mucicola FACHB-723]